MSLAALLDEGLALVGADPQRDLRPGYRVRLLRSLDVPGDRTRPCVGHRRRVRLGLLSVEKVLPAWDEAFPRDPTPRRALELAGQALTSPTDRAAVERECGSLWTHCDDLLWTHQEGQYRAMVGYAAIQLARAATTNGLLENPALHDGTAEIDVDPYLHDPFFLASVAHACGAPWEPEPQRGKRQEFWTWWLTRAVHRAVELTV